MARAFPDGELDQTVEIGAVTDQTVRLWVRAAGTARLTVQLEVAGQPPVMGSVSLSPEADWTGAIDLRLPRPMPDQPFTCSAAGQVRTGWLAPAAEAHTGFTFGFGSCHEPFRLDDGTIVTHQAVGIYPAMRELLLQVEARFLLLCGDQIYSDVLDNLNVRDDLPGDADDPPPYDATLAAYRWLTRGFLGEAGFRAVREALPSYWIWDDHDIFDNWGSRREESALDQRLFAAASRVYGEYQHQRNPAGEIGLPPYSYRFRFGTAGFLVLDLRGTRSYQDGTLLGREQWRQVQDYLTGAESADLHTLFVVAGVPVAHVSRWFVRLFQYLPLQKASDVLDRWVSPAFIDSRNALLDALFAWQQARPYRQVIILSGDVHAASAFTIRQRAGPGVIQQFTSSAFTTPSSWLERLFNRIASRGANLFEPRYRFERHRFSLANNTGLVRLEPLAEGGHRVEFTIQAWQPGTRSLVALRPIQAVPDGAG